MEKIGESQSLQMPPGLTFEAIVEKNNGVIKAIQDLKNKPITKAKQGIIFGGLIFFALLSAGFIAFEIIKGAVALGVGFLTVVAVYYGYRYIKQADPLLQMKIRNNILKRMMEEARKNNISQLESYIIFRKAKLKSAQQTRDAVNSLLENLKMNVSESKSDSLRQKKTGMLEKVQKAYEQIVANIERLANSNNDLVERVEEYKDMQSFADMANTALSLMAETGSEELERMLSLEAFRSIDNEFASAIAKVDGFSQDLQLEKMEAGPWLKNRLNQQKSTVGYG